MNLSKPHSTPEMVSTEEKEATTTSTAAGSQQKDDNNEPDPIIQYILVRTDLDWGTGPMIAQACHASIAAIASTLSERTTKDYLANLESMHKVILKADKLDDITKVEQKLKEANIAHHVWIEKPENVISCLAVSPQRKPLVQAIFKHLKLLR